MIVQTMNFTHVCMSYKVKYCSCLNGVENVFSFNIQMLHFTKSSFVAMSLGSRGEWSSANNSFGFKGYVIPTLIVLLGL